MRVRGLTWSVLRTPQFDEMVAFFREVMRNGTGPRPAGDCALSNDRRQQPGTSCPAVFYAA
jgi:hypothetical protein